MIGFPPTPQSTKELIAIRKLLCAALLKAKILTQGEVGNILDKDRTQITREFAFLKLDDKRKRR